jgi:hypothetical protein
MYWSWRADLTVRMPKNPAIDRPIAMIPIVSNRRVRGRRVLGGGWSLMGISLW